LIGAGRFRNKPQGLLADNEKRQIRWLAAQKIGSMWLAKRASGLIKPPTPLETIIF